MATSESTNQPTGAFRRFLDTAVGTVDEHGRIDDMSLAKNAPLDQLSDGILMTLLYIGIEKKCGAESFEAGLARMVRDRLYRDSTERRRAREVHYG